MKKKGVGEKEKMILTDKDIKKEIQKGKIIIKPFRINSLGSNSYDVHLGKNLAIYENKILDAKKHNKTRVIKIPEEGIIIQPGELYLGVTEEYTETHCHVPFLEGKSSIGRLGIEIHSTAGKGDMGFCNYWTLEISAKKPVKIYPGMPIGQIIYFKTPNPAEIPYNKKPNAKYTKVSDMPQESMMWKNLVKKDKAERQIQLYIG